MSSLGHAIRIIGKGIHLIQPAMRWYEMEDYFKVGNKMNFKS